MNNQLKPIYKSIIRFFIAVFLAQAAVSLNFGLRLQNIQLSPTETVLRNYISLSNIAHLILLIFLVVTFLVNRKNAGGLKPRQKMWMPFIARYLIISGISYGIYWFTADAFKAIEYTRVAAENSLLIDAIEEYIADQGEPPGELLDLYPAYYDWGATVDNTSADKPQLKISIPSKFLDEESARLVTYQYQTNIVDTDQEQLVSWQLNMNINRGSVQPVILAYNPEGIYLADKVTRIGYPHEWAIIDDY